MSIIVALDAKSQYDALTLAEQLDPALCRVKVGKELFTHEGPSVVKALHGKGFEVFLDLKFHDIPNTTAQAVCAAADLGVWMVNVHASGGRKMMQTCAERLRQGNYPTQLIAVTVLTSMSREDLKDIGLDIEPFEQVKRLAKLTKKVAWMAWCVLLKKQKCYVKHWDRILLWLHRVFVLQVQMRMIKNVL